MKVKAWLERAKERIPAVDAELMVLMAFREDWPYGVDRSYLVLHDEAEITPGRLQYLTEMLVRRIKKEPLAYILGEKEFYGRMFWVTPEVLIPRPETESMIDLVKELKLPKQVRFFEVGTGSGCVAITLALEFPQAKVLATDISTQALDIAEQNDVIHEGRVEFIQADLIKDLADQIQNEPLPLSELPGEAELLERDGRAERMRAWFENLKFDVVVANLPYVNPAWTWLDAEALDYEPKTALFVRSENGLGLYRRFFDELELVETKYVVVEADPCQHDELVRLAEARGWGCQKIAGFALLFVPLAEPSKQ